VQYLDDAIALLKKDIGELTRERTLLAAQHPNRVRTQVTPRKMRSSKLSFLRTDEHNGARAVSPEA